MCRKEQRDVIQISDFGMSQSQPKFHFRYFMWNFTQLPFLCPDFLICRMWLRIIITRDFQEPIRFNVKFQNKGQWHYRCPINISKYRLTVCLLLSCISSYLNTWSSCVTIHMCKKERSKRILFFQNFVCYLSQCQLILEGLFFLL